MTWANFVYEFNQKFRNFAVLSVKQTEFLDFQQDNETATETMRKFAKLAKLCSYVVSKGRKASKADTGNTPTRYPACNGKWEEISHNDIDCFERVYRADQYFNQLKEKRQLICDDKQRQRELSGNWRNGN